MGVKAEGLYPNGVLNEVEELGVWWTWTGARVVVKGLRSCRRRAMADSLSVLILGTSLLSRLDQVPPSHNQRTFTEIHSSSSRILLFAAGIAIKLGTVRDVAGSRDISLLLRQSIHASRYRGVCMGMDMVIYERCDSMWYLT